MDEYPNRKFRRFNGTICKPTASESHIEILSVTDWRNMPINERTALVGSAKCIYVEGLMIGEPEESVELKLCQMYALDAPMQVQGRFC